MSLKPQPIQLVPKQTADVARAAFPKGNPYLIFRDEMGVIFQDDDFLDLYAQDGQPGFSPWRLAWVTIMQFRETLSDRQAAEAVRARLDWKYLLGLELTDPGFDFSVLSEFRARLLAGSAEELLLDKVLQHCQTQGLLKRRGQQRTDSTHVLAAIRALGRLELVGETLRAALNELAAVAPQWLQSMAPLEWYERYAKRVEDSRLPREQSKREAYAQSVGEDGFALLDALEEESLPQGLRDLPAIGALRQIWQRHYERHDTESTSEGVTAAHRVRFKDKGELPKAAEGLESPYDVDARYRTKRDTQWHGYMVHLSETCDPNEPHLLTHVHTTSAAVHEARCTVVIEEAMVNKDIAPKEHLVDAAYVSADLLVKSEQDYDIKLRGPTRPHVSWKVHVEEAYRPEDFHVNWEQQWARCPQDKTSISWKDRLDAHQRPFIQVQFSQSDCTPCEARTLCTRIKLPQANVLKLHPRPQHEAFKAAQAWFNSEEGKRQYGRRAGIEGTLSQGVRAFGLRRSRYRGLNKTHLQNVAIAAAINVERVVAWLDGRPRAQTRTSRFARLAPDPLTGAD
jgi:transposase